MTLHEKTNPHHLGHLLWCMLVALLLTSTSAIAIPVGTPLAFDHAEQEQRYQTLIRELRCTVCQNQSLVDSNAPLAHDLRRRIYEMVQDGHDRREIETFMVDRYGDYVLYRPPLRAGTFLLWLGPFLLLVAGGLVYAGVLRRNRRREAQPSIPLDEDEQARIRALTRRLPS